MRMSGVGLALVISFAIDQIFCFAPSINPDIEPVVSSTKQTSIRGFATPRVAFACLDESASFAAPSATKHARAREHGERVLFFIITRSNVINLCVTTGLDAERWKLLPLGLRSCEKSASGFSP